MTGSLLAWVASETWIMVAGEPACCQYIYNYIQYSFERGARVRVRVVEADGLEGVCPKLIGSIRMWKFVEKSKIARNGQAKRSDSEPARPVGLTERYRVPQTPET